MKWLGIIFCLMGIGTATSNQLTGFILLILGIAVLMLTRQRANKKRDDEYVIAKQKKQKAEAEKNLKEKIEYYKNFYDEDTIRSYVDDYGENFDLFIDEAEEDEQ